MPNGANRVWVTRTAPFNWLTAKRLAARGFGVLLLPALRVVAVPYRMLVAVPDALVFTSLNGIRLHKFMPSLADVDVFAVGEHSARYARAVGYRHAVSASGDIGDLASLILARFGPGAIVMHIGAVKPAGNLGDILAHNGIRLRCTPVYDVIENNLSEFDHLVEKQGDVATIMVHSQRAGGTLASWLGRRTCDWRGAVIGISSAAMAPFEALPGADIKVAARPNEQAMFDCLAGTPRQYVEPPAVRYSRSIA